MPATHASTSFPAAHAVLQRAIEDALIPGACYAVLRGNEVLATGCLGHANMETGEPLREDHLHRVFSNTKLVTSLAVMRAIDQDLLATEQPVGELIPELARLQVLRPGARTLDDTGPAREPVRLRHLLTHTAGFAYGFIEPESLLATAYRDQGVSHPGRTLAEAMTLLGKLPLNAQPGTAWGYSVATDILGRVLEVVHGQALDQVLHDQVFAPLAMRDTYFFVPPERAAQLARLYQPGPTAQRPTLLPADDLPYPGAYRTPVPRLNPGGGLVSTLGDTVRLLQTLLPGGPALVSAASRHALLQNQLPTGMTVPFIRPDPAPVLGFSFGGAVTLQPGPGEPAASQGEVQWGGLASTHWAVFPDSGIACAVMTQVMGGFWAPWWFDFKCRLLEDLPAR